MISEHIKLAKNHLKIEQDEKLSDELAEFIETLEEFMQNGARRNNLSRDALVACFALIKLLGREEILAGVKKQKKQEEERVADIQKNAVDVADTSTDSKLQDKMVSASGKRGNK